MRPGAGKELRSYISDRASDCANVEQSSPRRSPLGPQTHPAALSHPSRPGFINHSLNFGGHFSNYLMFQWVPVNYLKWAKTLLKCVSPLSFSWGISLKETWRATLLRNGTHVKF